MSELIHTEAFSDFTHIILYLINLSIATSTFPKREKLAIVKPILKSTSLDHQNFRSYRPVSNLSFLSKIIEKVIMSQ